MIGNENQLKQQVSHAKTGHFFTLKSLYCIFQQKSIKKYKNKLNLKSVFFAGCSTNSTLLSKKTGISQEQKKIILIITGFIYEITIIKTISTAVVFAYRCFFPPMFIMITFLSVYLQVKKPLCYPDGAVQQSRKVPALRLHLWGSCRSHKKLVAIVFVSIKQNCFILCLDKAVITSSLYRVACGPMPINSSTALSGPQPHGFFVHSRAGTQKHLQCGKKCKEEKKWGLKVKGMGESGSR
jgi:hypothetical protein